MQKIAPPTLLFLGAALVAASCATAPVSPAAGGTSGQTVDRILLPSPGPTAAGATVSLDQALATRRSIREFTVERLTLDEIGMLCWAAQGITDAEGARTAPSAGALYPLEVHVLAPDGLFRYLPDAHALERIVSSDRRAALQAAAMDQKAVGDAPVVLVISADPSRIEAKYGRERGQRYVWLEAGHAAQNVLLEAVALGLAGVPIGAFDDDRVAQVLGLQPGRLPLYLLSIGHAA